MKLGIISWFSENDFIRAINKGLEFIEVDVNDNDRVFLENVENIKALSEKYHLPIQAIGRWGTDRVDVNGIREEELSIEYKLIEAAERLGCGIYITGCNYIEEKSFYENCLQAISYFEKLLEHGRKHDVKIAIYNCRWNNFVHSEPAWTIIMDKLKDLYIKYDTSHCIYAGGDYLKEARDWVGRFAHVHIKGALVIDGERFDDPPAGLDQTDWRSFLAILYAKGYDGGLSIEPHSQNWHGELGEKGLNYTIGYMKEMIL